MTVYNNLAFPLRNRGVPPSEIKTAVHEIARMLDLEDVLDQRAAGLTADGKQKISLGRGLVRSDVNVIMFDEPLTVIDPHVKWQLRSKLKELHQRIGRTMIYVTHDQTEALTFADKVVVMHEGKVIQIGSPVELFERPQHTFVGHFIGSPGMNVLPCEVRDGAVFSQGGTCRSKIHRPPGSMASVWRLAFARSSSLSRTRASRSQSSRSATPAAIASSRRGTKKIASSSSSRRGCRCPQKALTSGSIPLTRGSTPTMDWRSEVLR